MCAGPMNVCGARSQRSLYHLSSLRGQAVRVWTVQCFIRPTSYRIRHIHVRHNFNRPYMSAIYSSQYSSWSERDDYSRYGRVLALHLPHLLIANTDADIEELAMDIFTNYTFIRSSGIVRNRVLSPVYKNQCCPLLNKLGEHGW